MWLLGMKPPVPTPLVSAIRGYVATDTKGARWTRIDTGREGHPCTTWPGVCQAPSGRRYYLAWDVDPNARLPPPPSNAGTEGVWIGWINWFGPGLHCGGGHAMAPSSLCMWLDSEVKADLMRRTGIDSEDDLWGGLAEEGIRRLTTGD